jgi:hypothetical protein
MPRGAMAGEFEDCDRGCKRAMCAQKLNFWGSLIGTNRSGTSAGEGGAIAGRVCPCLWLSQLGERWMGGGEGGMEEIWPVQRRAVVVLRPRGEK